MKLRFSILILVVTHFLLSCSILDKRENWEEPLLGVWYLQSYAKTDDYGNIITVSCPFNAAPGIADILLETSNSDLDGDGLPDTYFYEYYIKVDSSMIHSYYKINFTGTYEGEYSATNFLTGLFYDEYRIDTFSIDSNGEVTSSRDYISDMTVEIKEDILTLTGESVIKLKRATNLEIDHAEFISEYQFNMLDTLALCGLDFYFDSEDTKNSEDTQNNDLDIPLLDHILYREMVPVTGGLYTQLVAPLAEQEVESELFDTYIPSSPFQHTISDFSIGKYEVTYLLWYTVYMWAIENGYSFDNAGQEGIDDSYDLYGGLYGEDGALPTMDNYEPVTRINWSDTIVWCNAYSVINNRTPVYENEYGNAIKSTADITGMIPNWSNNGYRLPTEGEWQYAASGGIYSNGYTYSGSNLIDDVGWYYNNSYILGSSDPDYGTHNVGEKLENELGLFDMTGNVIEWCFDWYGSYPSDTTNYRGASSGNYRVLRGGHWTIQRDYCAVSYRLNNLPYNRDDSKGFRLAHY